MNKKIVLLTSSIAGGGSESVCISIANSFADSGWQVDLIVLNLNNEVYLNSISDKINLVVLNKKHARYCGLALLKYIYNNKPKKFLVFNYELTVILLILRFLLKLEIKIISRNTNTLSIKIKEFSKENFWSKIIVANLIKYIYQKADHVINQCHAMRNDLIKLYPKLDQNSSVIYNPLPNHVEVYLKNNDIRLIKKKNYILCVGRLEKQKAFHYAIEAFSRISKNFSNLRLKIIGQGNLEKELKQIALDFNVASKVDFEGFQKDTIKYYLFAKATVLTSLYEGYPNVLIESIAMNTPVVSFDCKSGPNEIIQNGYNGYLAKHHDVDDLTNKISYLLLNKLNDKDLKNSINQNQGKIVFKQYESLVYSIS